MTMSQPMSLAALMDALGRPRILVLGDLILDRYTWGDAERVSPEAPVVVLRADEEEIRLGGAASAAHLVRGLAAEVRLAGVVGQDAEGHTVRMLLQESGVDATGVLVDPSRPTTSKVRFVGRAAGRHPHQMLRVDREQRHDISTGLADQLANIIDLQLNDCDALLISDYGKGVCTPRLLELVISAARHREIPVLVDPARGVDPWRYRGATHLKPNRIEAQQATGITIHTPDDALTAGQRLCEKLGLAAAVITLARDGMMLVTPTGHQHIPTTPREVYDITGAGDMTLAALGVCVAAGIEIAPACRVANAAAGLEVSRLGVTPISRDELRQALSQGADQAAGADHPNPGDTSHKVTTLARLLPLVAEQRLRGRRVVFTNGCFDLLHVGHLHCLEEAAALGDILIVAINSDASVKRLKGPGRPIVPEHDRARLLAGLACVDHVVIFEEDTPHPLLNALRPDILVKGGTTPVVIGSEVVQAYDGQVARTTAMDGVSTSSILEHVQIHSL